MPPYMANRIAEAGFNIVAVANNHSRDFGDKGYKQTQEYLKNAGIKIVGNILNTATIIEIKNKLCIKYLLKFAKKRVNIIYK